MNRGLKGVNRTANTPADVAWHPASESDIDFGSTDKWKDYQTVHAPIYDRTLGSIYADENFGKSIYDKRATALGDVMDINDFRGREQGWYFQLSNGILKGALTAGNTVFSDIVGTLYGLGAGAYRAYNAEKGERGAAFVDGLWNNAITQASAKISEAMEEALPNYYTNEELEAPWYKNILSANFLGDKFIKNMGFTVGSMASVALMGGVTGAVAKGAGMAGKAVGMAAKAANAGRATLANINKAARGTRNIVQYALNSALAANGEASIEAVNATKDIQNSIAMDIAQKRELGLQEINGLDISDEDRSLKIAELDIELDKYKKIQEDNLRNMGNMIWGANMGILTLSNTLQFYDIMRGGFKQAVKLNKPVFTADGKEIGLADVGRAVLRGSKINVSNTAEGVSRGELARTGVKNFISEGWEEGSQNFVSNTADEVFHQRSDEANRMLLDRQLDSYSRDKVTDYTAAAMKTWNEQFGGISSPGWEEVFIGGLTGLIGSPTVKRNYTKNDKGQIQFDPQTGKPLSKLQFGWAGGVYGEYADAQRENEERDNLAKELTERLQNDDFLNRWQHAVTQTSFEQEFNDAMAKNDIYEFKNAEIGQLVSDILYFKRNGMIDAFHDMLKGIEGMTDEDFDLLYAATQNQQTGQSPLDDESKRKLKDKWKDKASKNLEQMEKFEEYYDYVESAFAERGQDFKSELAYMYMQHDDNRRRMRDIADKNGFLGQEEEIASGRLVPMQFNPQDYKDYRKIDASDKSLMNKVKMYEAKPELLDAIISSKYHQAEEFENLYKENKLVDNLLEKLKDANSVEDIHSILYTSYQRLDSAKMQKFLGELIAKADAETRAKLKNYHAQLYLADQIKEIENKLMRQGVNASTFWEAIRTSSLRDISEIIDMYKDWYDKVSNIKTYNDLAALANNPMYSWIAKAISDDTGTAIDPNKLKALKAASFDVIVEAELVKSQFGNWEKYWTSQNSQNQSGQQSQGGNNQNQGSQSQGNQSNQNQGNQSQNNQNNQNQSNQNQGSQSQNNQSQGNQSQNNGQSNQSQNNQGSQGSGSQGSDTGTDAGINPNSGNNQSGNNNSTRNKTSLAIPKEAQALTFIKDNLPSAYEALLNNYDENTGLFYGKLTLTQMEYIASKALVIMRDATNRQKDQTLASFFKTTMPNNMKRSEQELKKFVTGATAKQKVLSEAAYEVLYEGKGTSFAEPQENPQPSDDSKQENPQPSDDSKQENQSNGQEERWVTDVLDKYEKDFVGKFHSEEEREDAARMLKQAVKIYYEGGHISGDIGSLQWVLLNIYLSLYSGQLPALPQRIEEDEQHIEDGDGIVENYTGAMPYRIGSDNAMEIDPRSDIEVGGIDENGEAAMPGVAKKIQWVVDNVLDKLKSNGFKFVTFMDFDDNIVTRKGGDKVRHLYVGIEYNDAVRKLLPEDKVYIKESNGKRYAVVSILGFSKANPKSQASYNALRSRFPASGNGIVVGPEVKVNQITRGNIAGQKNMSTPLFDLLYYGDSKNEVSNPHGLDTNGLTWIITTKKGSIRVGREVSSYYASKNERPGQVYVMIPMPNGQYVRRSVKPMNLSDVMAQHPDGRLMQSIDDAIEKAARTTDVKALYSLLVLAGQDQTCLLIDKNDDGTVTISYRDYDSSGPYQKVTVSGEVNETSNKIKEVLMSMNNGTGPLISITPLHLKDNDVMEMLNDSGCLDLWETDVLGTVGARVSWATDEAMASSNTGQNKSNRQQVEDNIDKEIERQDREDKRGNLREELMMNFGIDSLSDLIADMYGQKKDFKGAKYALELILANFDSLSDEDITWFNQVAEMWKSEYPELYAKWQSLINATTETGSFLDDDSNAGDEDVVVESEESGSFLDDDNSSDNEDAVVVESEETGSFLDDEGQNPASIVIDEADRKDIFYSVISEIMCFTDKSTAKEFNDKMDKIAKLSGKAKSTDNILDYLMSKGYDIDSILLLEDMNEKIKRLNTIFDNAINC